MIGSVAAGVVETAVVTDPISVGGCVKRTPGRQPCVLGSYVVDEEGRVRIPSATSAS
jgi:hypothetical protein